MCWMMKGHTSSVAYQTTQECYSLDFPFDWWYIPYSYGYRTLDYNYRITSTDTRINSDGNNADAKIYLQSKAADRWGDKGRSGHLPKKRSVVVYEYNHYLRSSITLPALTFTEKDCNNVLVPDFNQELLSSFLRIPSTSLKVTDASVYVI